MKQKVLRKLFLGFIQVHVLYHAGEGPIYGSWIIEELKRHGYDISAGTLYPLLHELYKQGLLEKHDEVVKGKVRKYYILTAAGVEVLQEARQKALELVKELTE
ncbi:MAG: PadR family transcriptional regulator [Bacillota bacterium]